MKSCRTFKGKLSLSYSIDRANHKAGRGKIARNAGESSPSRSRGPLPLLLRRGGAEVSPQGLSETLDGASSDSGPSLLARRGQGGIAAFGRDSLERFNLRLRGPLPPSHQSGKAAHKAPTASQGALRALSSRGFPIRHKRSEGCSPLAPLP